jgi:predicted AAA+ superfamily ATPase
MKDPNKTRGVEQQSQSNNRDKISVIFSYIKKSIKNKIKYEHAEKNIIIINIKFLFTAALEFSKLKKIFIKNIIEKIIKG